MSEPLVCVVCLTKDRPALLQRAIRCFRSQTYENKHLLIYDSTETDQEGMGECIISKEHNITHVRFSPEKRAAITVGLLRNRANRHAATLADILMHWDDDDWSAPTRMAEQVALLQSSGAASVGYNEMLFWRKLPGEAWLYRHPRATYCIGTSLCYWRKTWEAKPFPNLHAGEDTEWARDLRTESISSIAVVDDDTISSPSAADTAPRLVAEIHGRNTTAHVQPGKSEWKRVAQWDDRLKSIMTI